MINLFLDTRRTEMITLYWTESMPAVRAVYIYPESLDAFKEMVARACNCWPDAPPAIKEFHDRLIHGAPLQDYYGRNDVRKLKCEK